uniref:Uncharacterized protein n=1 Tax=Romanomermis culicivorax TaxID=13658 RepID=A0A915L059_ROMCU
MNTATRIARYLVAKLSKINATNAKKTDKVDEVWSCREKVDKVVLIEKVIKSMNSKNPL